MPWNGTWEFPRRQWRQWLCRWWTRKAHDSIVVDMKKTVDPVSTFKAMLSQRKTELCEHQIDRHKNINNDKIAIDSLFYLPRCVGKAIILKKNKQTCVFRLRLCKKLHLETVELFSIRSIHDRCPTSPKPDFSHVQTLCCWLNFHHYIQHSPKTWIQFVFMGVVVSSAGKPKQDI